MTNVYNLDDKINLKKEAREILRLYKKTPHNELLGVKLCYIKNTPSKVVPIKKIGKFSKTALACVALLFVCTCGALWVAAIIFFAVAFGGIGLIWLLLLLMLMR